MKIKPPRKQTVFKLVYKNQCWWTSPGRIQADRVSVLLCRVSRFHKSFFLTSRPPWPVFSLRGTTTGILWLQRGGGVGWVVIGRKSICLSWQWSLSRLKRGLRLRAAAPDLPSHWAGGRGREDSGCGTWVLFSLGSLGPVSACTPADTKPTETVKFTHSWLEHTHGSESVTSVIEFSTLERNHLEFLFSLRQSLPLTADVVSQHSG